MQNNKMLYVAKERFFRGPFNDFSAKIAQETLIIGLTKLLSLQKYLGYAPDAIVVCFPGTTPTRGADRLQRGYSLGIVVKYNYLATNLKKEPLIILDPKANCCGVLVASTISNLPSKRQLKEKINKLIQENPKINHSRIGTENYFIGNHFVNVYQKDSFKEKNKHWLVIHGSGEVRKDTKMEMGIYIDESQKLQVIAKHHDTCFGPIYYLLGEKAMAFMRQYKRVEVISVQSREYIAKKIAPDLKILCNVSHFTITAPGSYFCGVYNVIPGQIYPFLINEIDGIALMQASQNFSPEAINFLGWTKQAIKADAQKVLQSINGLPHGGRKIYGDKKYKLDNVYANKKKIMYSILNDNKKLHIDNLKILGPITYEGKDELDFIKKLGLANEIGRLYFGKNGYSLNAKN